MGYNNASSLTTSFLLDRERGVDWCEHKTEAHKVKILVVDDSQLDRKLLIRTLQKAGIENEILQAADGESAVDCLNLEYKNICLIFLDWQMPKVDGLEILKRIARNPDTAAIPVVMLTSTSNPENEEIAQLLNPNLAAFVVKPLDPDKVIKVALAHIK